MITIRWTCKHCSARNETGPESPMTCAKCGQSAFDPLDDEPASRDSDPNNWTDEQWREMFNGVRVGDKIDYTGQPEIPKGLFYEPPRDWIDAHFRMNHSDFKMLYQNQWLPPEEYIEEKRQLTGHEHDALYYGTFREGDGPLPDVPPLYPEPDAE